MRILIVDDETANQKILKKLLSPFGRCEVADNGKKAIDAYLQALNDGDPYILITLDIKMPDMDGQDVLRRIRGIERERGLMEIYEAKIIMITAMEDTQNIINSFHSGCTSYIIKPISKKKLVDALYSLKLIKDNRLTKAER